MGVQGLWELLHPVGRPVRLESLSGKCLAIDASIWLNQFLKAMRDADGNPLRNAHLLGFFKRICKLLYYKIKPVFVFDGAAPALKQKTLSERRRRQDRSNTSLKKTAEKLLSNQLRARALASVAEAKSKKSKRASDDDDSAPSTVPESSPSQPPETSLERKRKRDPFELPKSNIVEIDEPVVDEPFPSFSLRSRFNDDYKGEFRFLIDNAGTQIDIDSEEFAALPPLLQHEIVAEMTVRSRETSWARLNEKLLAAPKPIDFSRLQIRNTVKRAQLWSKMDEVRDALRQESNIGGAESHRIVSEDAKEYILHRGNPTELLQKLSAQTTIPELVVPEEESNASKEEVSFPPRGLFTSFAGAGAAASALLQKPAAEHIPDFDSFEKDIAMSPIEDNDANGDDGNEEDEGMQQAIQASLQQSSSYTKTVSSDHDLEEEEFEEVPVLKHTLASAPESSSETETLSPELIVTKLLRQIPPSVEAAMPTIRKDVTALSSMTEKELNAKLVNVLRRKQKSEASGDESNRFALVFLKDAIEAILALYKPSKQALFKPSPNKEPDHQLQNKAARINNHTKAAQLSLPARQVVPVKASVNALASEDEEEDEEIFEPVSTTENASTTLVSTDKQATPPPKLVAENKEVSSSSSSSEIVPSDSPAMTAQNQEVQLEPPRTLRSRASTLLRFSDDEEDEEEEDDHPMPRLSMQDKGKMPARSLSPEIILSSNHASPSYSSPQDLPELLEEPVYNDSAAQRSRHSDDDDEDLHRALSLSLEGQTQVSAPTDLDEDEQIRMAIELSLGRPVDVSSAVKSKVDTPTSVPLQQPSSSSSATAAANHQDEDDDTDLRRFLQSINKPDVDMSQLSSQLDKERQTLKEQQRKNQRDASTVTDDMVTETQEMLRLFGVPFIVAPSEAEAQCAHLESLKLVDGTVTDDADALLFGAKLLYKNMFNPNKHVEMFVASDIQREVGLDRDKLISLAYLLGSDYTDGLPGVGAVWAMEILKEFPGENGLKNFSDWWRQVYEGGLDETTATSDFKRRFIKSKRKLHIQPGFPDAHVASAYKHPIVDDSNEAFVHGLPDLDGLRRFVTSRFLWDQAKADETLLPVMRKLTETTTQSRLEDYFGPSTLIRAQPIHSSTRVRNAVSALLGKPEETPVKRQRQRAKPAEEPAGESSSHDSNMTSNGDQPSKPKRKRQYKKATPSGESIQQQQQPQPSPRKKKQKHNGEQTVTKITRKRKSNSNTVDDHVVIEIEEEEEEEEDNGQ